VYKPGGDDDPTHRWSGGGLARGSGLKHDQRQRYRSTLAISFTRSHACVETNSVYLKTKVPRESILGSWWETGRVTGKVAGFAANPLSIVAVACELWTERCLSS